MSLTLVYPKCGDKRKVIGVYKNPCIVLLTVSYITEKYRPPFDKKAIKAPPDPHSLTRRVKKIYSGMRDSHPYFHECTGNFTFSILLTEYSITGSIGTKRSSFFGMKSSHKYFPGELGFFELGFFRSFFFVYW